MRVHHLYVYCSLTACSLVERSYRNGEKGYVVAKHNDGTRRFVSDDEIRATVPDVAESSGSGIRTASQPG